MLAQQRIGQSMRRLLVLGALVSVSCTSAQSQIFFNQKEGQKFVAQLNATSFCKKYKCKIGSYREGMRLVNLTKPSQRMSSGSIDPAVPVNAVLWFSSKDGVLSRARIYLGKDFPTNDLDRNYSEIANEFVSLVVGRQIMQKSEYFFGGDITNCMVSLAERQSEGISTTSSLIVKGKASNGSSYKVTCGQPMWKEKKQIDRWLEISKI